MALTLKSEPVSPTGSISSIGIFNQLGRPDLDTLAILIRETVQNSWDARSADAQSMSYMVQGWELNASQTKILRKEVFSARPKPESLAMTWLDGKGPMYGLVIADRGTTGLRGPTRADVVPEGSPRNFISFLRDVGQPHNQPLSGGTYGFGKASLYRASGMQTILVHTRCKLENGRLESRFIASALGSRWADKKGRQYTGRHWWGADGGNIAEPILNRDADAFARSLGMGGFDKNETGTTILILDPIINDQVNGQQMRDESIVRTPLQAMNLMSEYILWYFWPKMLIGTTGQPAVQFQLQWEDINITLPRPSEFPPLTGFVEAMERLKGIRDDKPTLRSIVSSIGSERPRQHLGKLALQQFIIEKMRWFDTGNGSSPFDVITHHTALMRQAELVVKYLEGKPPSDSRIGYAGVFITSEDVDEIFASAEPPTHDDWNPKSLTHDWHKRFVRAALRKIDDEMRGFIPALATADYQGLLTPLGSFATWLGESLIPTEIGTSASRGRPGKHLPGFLIRTDTNSPTGSANASSNMSDGAEPAANYLDPSMFPTASGNEIGHQLSSNSEIPAGIQPSLTDLVHTREYLPPPPSAPTSLLQTSESKPPAQKIIYGRSTADIVNDELVEYDGMAALVITFDVKHAQNADGTTVSLRAHAVLDSAIIEDDPPIGGSTARVVRWIDPSGQSFAGSENIYIAVDQPSSEWQVLVVLPDDIMASVDFDARAEVVQ